MNKPNKTIITFKAPYLPILVVVLLVLQIIFPFKGWMILLIVFGGVWYTSKRWAHSLANNLSLKREHRYGWAQVGDPIQERFTLENHGWAPGLWVTILDQSTMPGYSASSVRPVSERSKNFWHTHGTCLRRGLYMLGPTTIETGDPLGIYTVQIEYHGSETMMVTPPVIPLPQIEVAPAGRTDEGRFMVRAQQNAVNVSTVREYIPGDSLRWIHWPTSAKRSKLFVRTFDSTPSSDWWIFLDMNKNAQVGEGEQSTEEHGIILAASLASRGIETGKAVGFVSQGENLAWLPPRMSNKHQWEILHELALIEPGSKPLSVVLEAARGDFIRRTGIVLITSDISGTWIPPLLRMVRLGAVPTVILLDPKTYGGITSTKQVETELIKLGIVHHIIPADLLDNPDLIPKKELWRITPLGRAIPTDKDATRKWKTLV